MKRIPGILSLFCLAAALLLAVLPGPWDAAGRKADADAARLGALAGSPDRISWRISEDPALLRVMVWDDGGTRRYPPPDGMAPIVYEFSDEAGRELAHLRETASVPVWAPFDMTGRELLNCRPVPAVCLLYDRAVLEETLGLRHGALTSRGRGRYAVSVLAAFAIALAGVFLWLLRPPPVPAGEDASPDFLIVPERHVAIRGTLEVALTRRDLKLLAAMQERGGAVVTKDELYDAGWGRDYMPNSCALDQHIINLRRKLDPDKSRPVLIETVRGVGYRLVP